MRCKNNGSMDFKRNIQEQISIFDDNYDMASAPTSVKYFFFQPSGNGIFEWNIFTPDPGHLIPDNRFREIWIMNRTMSDQSTLTLNINNNVGSYGSGGRYISPGQPKRGNKLIATYGQALALVSTCHVINFYGDGRLGLKWCWMVTMAPTLQPS
jgi:hypothetical protein